jgi:hypothetical protein
MRVTQRERRVRSVLYGASGLAMYAEREEESDEER